MKWNPHHGLYSHAGPEAEWIAGEHEEQEIFDSLKLRFVPSEKRN